MLQEPIFEPPISTPIRMPITSLRQWEESRQVKDCWGWKRNIEWHVGEGSARSDDFMRIKMPQSLAGTMTDSARPDLRSGAGFLVSHSVPPSEAYSLTYRVRFPVGFDFVRGGKLPGLYGGTAPMGGKVADGENGFTARYMWIEGGDGEIYLYAPYEQNDNPHLIKKTDGATRWGLSLGKGAWKFQADDQWHTVSQNIILNKPGEKNGIVEVQYDDVPVLHEEGMYFRNTDKLQIDGLCVSSFFGGNDPRYAPSSDTYVDFKDFEMNHLSLPYPS